MDGYIGVEHHTVQQVVLQYQCKEVEDDQEHQQSPKDTKAAASETVLAILDQLIAGEDAKEEGEGELVAYKE